MNSGNDFLALFEKRYAYSGRILQQNGYDRGLKKRLAKAIVHLDALEKIGTPVLPYIAAWKPGNGDIWYEYAGSRLRKMLGGSKAGDQLAEAFHGEILALQGNQRRIRCHEAVQRQETE